MPAPADSPAPPEERICVEPGSREGTPNLRQVALIAVIAILFTVAYLALYGLLNNVVWSQNNFVQPTPGRFRQASSPSRCSSASAAGTCTHPT
ncbi:hypothetical protein DSECCO2_437110 [anaerobic digester metagenome]